MKFKGTIVITDPCYLDQNSGKDLWKASDYGEDLSVFGCSQWICEDTIYGDWSCFTYKGTEEEVHSWIDEWDELYFAFLKDYNNPDISPNVKEALLVDYNTKKEEFKDENTLGEFCADAGMVCVVYLDEVLKVNPNFKDWALNHPWCATIIEDFDGNVNYTVDAEEAHIVGEGNVNFYTSQSGL